MKSKFNELLKKLKNVNYKTLLRYIYTIPYLLF